MPCPHCRHHGATFTSPSGVTVLELPNVLGLGSDDVDPLVTPASAVMPPRGFEPPRICSFCGVVYHPRRYANEEEPAPPAAPPEDWAIDRMLELRQAGEKATFRVEWQSVGGRRVVRLGIRRQDGSFEMSPPSPLSESEGIGEGDGDS